MGRTKIEWASDSWNPIRARNRVTGKLGWFCVHESEGCRFCYAESLNRRLGTGIDYKAQNLDLVEVFLDEKILTQPLRWRQPRRVFPCSMTDIFGEWVPDWMLDKMFAVMALTPHHTYLPLTKRAERMRVYLTAVRRGNRDIEGRAFSLPIDDHALTATRIRNAIVAGSRNIWAGVSVEDQRRADERIPLLLETPAAVRWVSYEPALEGIDIARYLRRMVVRPCEELTDRMMDEGWSHPGGQGDHPGISWVVCGGESGAQARPFDIEWARSIIGQCKAADVPFFYKQGGASNRCPHDAKGGHFDCFQKDLQIREFP
jgi:protein gp37